MIGHIKSRQYFKKIARAIFKKYCPPHKARGIHVFILATKSPVWIIIVINVTFCHTADKLKSGGGGGGNIASQGKVKDNDNLKRMATLLDDIYRVLCAPFIAS